MIVNLLSMSPQYLSYPTFENIKYKIIISFTNDVTSKP